jgi:hypothetical protein
MKIKLHSPLAAGIFIVFSFVIFSCSSAKKSAVPCPDFSHSRNMKRGHAQLKNTYPDHLATYHFNLTGFTQKLFKASSKTPGGLIRASRHYPVQENKEYLLPASAILPGVIPVAGMHTSLAAATVIPETLKWMKTGSPGCDTIVLRNGDLLEGKVLEIGEREIRYRKCDNPEGPVFVTNITDVFMIKYPNGTRDYFTTERSTAPSMAGKAPKKTDGMAVAGFVGSLVGLFIAGIPLGIMAIVFGFVSLGKMNRHPDRYRGRGFGIASIIIGAIDVIGMLIILAAA